MAVHMSAIDRHVVLPLDAADASLDACGGKGLNLSRLARAGFPVPPGFVLATRAYRSFVVANNLGPRISAACQALDASDAAGLEAASAAIRAAFVESVLPPEIEEAVRSAWSEAFTPDTAVAVRSSATAEDLPDLSFAGQQDTFLNIIGVEATLDAIVRCWSSLWTARAVGYRIRNGVPHDDVALAVVVQRLVPAEVSGVLFTANPLTGAREEVVIDATFGLGEALVSGQVEPDHLVVSTETGVVTRSLGAKAVSTTPMASGGVTTSARRGDTEAALTDDQARELAEIGREVERALSGPQDIEWTISDARLQLVQARPVTSLFPVPDGDPDAVWFSFGAVQGMLQPITPLGRDALTLILSGLTALLGSPVDLRDAGYLRPAGERLWIRVDRLMQHPMGARLLPRALSAIEPGSAAIVADLALERDCRPAVGRPTGGDVRRALRVASRFLPRIPGTMIDPAGRRLAARAALDRVVREADGRLSQASRLESPEARLRARIDMMREALGSLATHAAGGLSPVLGPTVGLMAAVTAAGARAGERGRMLGLEVLRSVPGNVTTEMDLALWRAAAAMQADPASLQALESSDAQTLADRYAAGTLPGVAQKAVASFLAAYGMRGVAEIDVGRPRWRENPVDVMLSLQSYVRITEPHRAPDVVFARGEVTARRAADELVDLLAPGTGLGARVRAARWRFVIDRLRQVFGVRELPKFTIVRLAGLFREALLASGRDLVDAGIIARADDIFFLHLDELERLYGEPEGRWRALIEERRRVNERERLRRQVPRILLGTGRAFYEGLGGHDGGLSGSPVSPGVVEGTVRVVFDPQAGNLRPGEILVCPGTDPAWTPLFLTAGGLVTEVGGMMTHGAVVAREYGIPAVVGVHEATSRLNTGQHIRLDGTSGVIEVLDETNA